MPNSNKSTNLTNIPDYVWIFFVMLFQYLNCVFNIQSHHGIWEMLQHFFTKHRENGLKLTDFLYCPVRLAKLVLLNTSGYRLLSTSTSTPNKGIFLEIALSYVWHEASYWRLILIECLGYWLLHALALSCRPRGRVHSVNNLGGLCVRVPQSEYPMYVNCP